MKSDSMNNNNIYNVEYSTHICTFVKTIRPRHFLTTVQQRHMQQLPLPLAHNDVWIGHTIFVYSWNWDRRYWLLFFLPNQWFTRHCHKDKRSSCIIWGRTPSVLNTKSIYVWDTHTTKKEEIESERDRWVGGWVGLWVTVGGGGCCTVGALVEWCRPLEFMEAGSLMHT